MKKSIIVVCRHGESIEDINKEVYKTLSDSEITLTEKGHEESLVLGEKLNAIFKNRNRTVKIFSSSILRNTMTMNIIAKELRKSINVSMEIEPLLNKQDRGLIVWNNMRLIEKERYKVGVLKYNYPGGETALSLLTRLKKFINRLEKEQKGDYTDIIILSHAVETRILLKLLLRWSNDLFESFQNLHPCEYRILTKHENNYYSIDRELKNYKSEKPIKNREQKLK